VALVGPAEPWIEPIRNLPGVVAVEELGDRLVVRVQAGELSAEDLLESILTTGARIRMFQPDAVDMETAFMKLTDGRTA
jgi:ABC-2 type transport system ATP-binding protein